MSIIVSDEWQHYQLLTTFIVRGSYVTVLSKYATFEDVVTGVYDYIGRNMTAAARPFVILSQMRVRAGDEGFLEAGEMPQLIVE